MRTCYYTDIVMACPLFLPAAPLQGFAAEATPLGELYDGACAGDRGAVIPRETLRRCCNRGYARGSCDRAAAADADAFRFLVKADCGGVITVAWSSEREHVPVAVGEALVTTAPCPTADPLGVQARACAAAYRRFSGKEPIAMSSAAI